MLKITKKIQLMLAVVLLCGSMTACEGGRSSQTSYSEAYNPAVASKSVDYGTNAASGAIDGDMEEIAWEEDSDDFTYDETEDYAQVPTPEQTAKKIVYSGSFGVETVEYEKTKEDLEKLFAECDAVVETSSEYDGIGGWNSGSFVRTGGRTCNWQIRVPSEKFDLLFEKAGNLNGVLRNKEKYSNDMTKHYNDTAVQIESLTVQQKNLMEMMKSAKKISDMLDIEDRLSEVNSELKILTNANNQIDYDVQYSSVSVSLQEVAVYTQETISFKERLLRSVKDSCENFIRFAKDAVIWLVYAVPYLILFAILIPVLHWFFSKIFRRKKFRREKISKNVKRTEHTEKAEDDADSQENI